MIKLVILIVVVALAASIRFVAPYSSVAAVKNDDAQALVAGYAPKAQGVVEQQPVVEVPKPTPLPKLTFPLVNGGATRWGRNAIILTQLSGKDSDATEPWKLWYCEYQFAPDGTFRYYGVMYSQPFVVTGDYEISGGTIAIRHREVLEGQDKATILDTLGTVTASLEQNPTTGRRMFNSGIHTYLEDFWWEDKGYRDSSGQEYRDPSSNESSGRSIYENEEKDPVYRLFPYRSGDFTIRAELSNDGQAIAKLIIVPFFHFAGPNDKKMYEEEKQLAVKGAKKWLKESNISPSIPTEVRIED